jgi:putative ABC transport system permease protein
VLDPRAQMEARLLWASLWKRRGTAGLAALAVAIGASVAAALLHVSGDVDAKLSRELRALGPNLVLAPSATGGERTLDERAARARCEAAGVRGVPVLYATALTGGHAIPVAGADLAPLAALHPSWRRSGAPDAEPAALAGAALARRLDWRAGDSLDLTSPDGERSLHVRIGATFTSGTSDEEALWLPLGSAQWLAAEPGRASLVQARVAGGASAVERAAARLERGGGMEALPLRALSATEQGLLDRMRRLMLLVTLAALAAGALSAYGTLTDLALERKREIALLKAVGAPRRRIVGRFLAESMAIGLVGGALGWLLGAAFALFIGREVFHATLTLQPGVPPLVVGLAMLTALVAAAGPIRLALAIEPARALREDG